MTDNIPIPAEVVEAAARAAYETWCEQIRKRETDTAGIELVEQLCPPWDDLESENCEDWLSQARAAFLAMMKAWPDMAYRVMPYAALILPLTETSTKENDNG